MDSLLIQLLIIFYFLSYEFLNSETAIEGLEHIISVKPFRNEIKLAIKLEWSKYEIKINLVVKMKLKLKWKNEIKIDLILRCKRKNDLSMQTMFFILI